MRVRDSPILTRRTLLLRLGRVVDDDARRSSNIQTNVDQCVAHIVWVSRDGDLMPVTDKLNIHVVHERGIVVPDRLRYAVFCFLYQDEFFRRHGLDFVGHVGPAVFQVLDWYSLSRFLGLQVGFELRGVSNSELGLVVVEPCGVVEANAVVLGGRVEELAQLLPVWLFLSHIQVLHDFLEGQLLQAILQMVAREAELRIDVVTGACVCWLGEDDVRRINGALALCAICGRVGRSG